MYYNLEKCQILPPSKDFCFLLFNFANNHDYDTKIMESISCLSSDNIQTWLKLIPELMFSFGGQTFSFSGNFGGLAESENIQ